MGRKALSLDIDEICNLCLERHTARPLTEYVYCKHKSVLAVQFDDGWKHFPAVSLENLEEWLAEFFRNREDSD